MAYLWVFQLTWNIWSPVGVLAPTDDKASTHYCWIADHYSFSLLLLLTFIQKDWWLALVALLLPAANLFSAWLVLVRVIHFSVRPVACVLAQVDTPSFGQLLLVDILKQLVLISPQQFRCIYVAFKQLSIVQQRRIEENSWRIWVVAVGRDAGRPLRRKNVGLRLLRDSDLFVLFISNEAKYQAR